DRSIAARSPRTALPADSDSLDVSEAGTGARPFLPKGGECLDRAVRGRRIETAERANWRVQQSTATTADRDGHRTGTGGGWPSVCSGEYGLALAWTSGEAQ